MINEFQLKRDAQEALSKLDSVKANDGKLIKLRAKIQLINVLQKEILSQYDGELGQAKKLLALLDLQNDNITTVLDQLNIHETTQFVIDDLEDDLFDALIKSINRKTKQDQNRKSLTGEKLFQHSLPYTPEPKLKYTNRVVDELLDLIKNKDWNSAFKIILTIEPDIPKNLQVPRMQQPLLQKYLWSAIKGFEQLAVFKQNPEHPLSLQEMQQYLNLSKYDFDFDHSQLLKEQLENL